MHEQMVLLLFIFLAYLYVTCIIVGCGMNNVY